MNLLSFDVMRTRSHFLFSLRSFFFDREFWEIDTPKLKKSPGMEPHLDPFTVSSPHSKVEGYLVTSPEYSLKIALSMGAEKIYEIAHSYRSGEKGNLHTSEFLMLEFYQSGINEQELIDVCIDLFEYLEKNFKPCGFLREKCVKISMGKLFQKHTGRGFSKEEILLTLSEKFPDKTEEYSTMKYDDLFFLTFLNLVEPFLQKDPVFIYNYPPELASLARVVNERAKRFEIYWKGVEIGNAFYELTDHELQYKRFVKEQEERLALGKEVFTVDEEFLAALKRGLPDCSGIAIGLDRLFMIFTGAKDLRFISPYFFPK